MTPSLFLFSSSWRSWIVYAALIATVAAVLFGNLRHHPPGIDDASTFRDNVATSQDFSFFFESPEVKELGSGRPLAEFTKWLAYSVWGNDSAAFHLLVVVIHALASLLLAAVAFRLGAHLELCFLGGLLFLANAAHFSAVHWISAMDYPLALFWGLVALWCYGEQIESHRRSWFVGFHLALILGIMAHVAVVAILPVCLYLSHLHGRRLMFSLWRLIPAGVAAGGVAILLMAFTARDTTTWSALTADLGDTPWVALELLRSFLWLPGRLVSTAHWMWTPLFEQHPWELGLGGCALASMIWLIWRRRFPASLWSIWTLSFLLPFVPLTLVHTGISRYIYLASAGSSVLLSWVLQRGCCGLAARSRPLGVFVFVGFVLALLASSYAALRKAEFVSLYRSGRYHYAVGEDRKGLQLLAQSLEGAGNLIPRASAYHRMVTLSLTLGDDYQPLLREALEAFPDDFNLRAVLAVAESLSEDASTRQRGIQSLAALQRETDRREFNHAVAVIHHNLGHRYRVLNLPEPATRAFETALVHGPHRINSAQGLAWAQFESGRFSQAAETATEVALRMPHSSEYLHLAARSLKEAGRLQRAAEVAKLGLMTQPSAELYLLLSRIHADSGDEESAARVLEEATISLIRPAQREDLGTSKTTKRSPSSPQPTRN